MTQWGQNPQPGVGTRWTQPPPQWNARSSPWGYPQQPGVPARTSVPGYPAPSGGGPARSSGLRSTLLAIIIIAAGIIAAFVLLNGPAEERQQTPTTSGQYSNEEYQVPPADLNPPELPQPETYAQASLWLQDNSIYSRSVSVPVRCDAVPIDITRATKAELQVHFDELTACLMRVFAPPLQAAGFIAVRPSVTIYSGEVQTACGTLPAQNAVYCAADQQVYYASDLYRIIPVSLRSGVFIGESVVAHEFAHAIQARTGILISEMAWSQRVSQSDALELSRRTEVQADCWAGQFLQSVGQSVQLGGTDTDDIAALFFAIGDDQLTGDPMVVGNHGHGASRQAWLRTGLSQTSMGACNTFVADSDQVR